MKMILSLKMNDSMIGINVGRGGSTDVLSNEAQFGGLAIQAAQTALDDPNELPNKNDETDEDSTLTALVLPTRRRRRTRKISNLTWGKKAADSLSPLWQGDTKEHQHSTKNKETKKGIGHSIRNNGTLEIMKHQHSITNDETLQMMDLPHSTRYGETSETKKPRSSTRKTETSILMEPRRSSRNHETLEMIDLRYSARNGDTSGTTKLRSLTKKTGEHRRTSRKRKQLMYNIIEVTTDEDEDEDEDEYEEDETNYPLPPLIQVHWADGVKKEIAKGVPMKGLTAPRDKGRTKRNWPSLRICATGESLKAVCDGSK